MSVHSEGVGSQPMSTPAPSPRADSRGHALVIIPAFDEEANIATTLASLQDACEDIDIVVVDDGSTDATAALARSAGATVLVLPFNLGIGGALRTGFRYAVRHGYQRAVQFDADGQHDPASIPTLLAAVDEGVDLAIGSRFADAGGYEVSRMRAGAMGMLRLVARGVAGQRFTDTSSGCRAFSRPMLEFFAADYPSEYLESVEALLLAAVEGYGVREVPVVMHQRRDGRPSQHRLALLYHFVRVLLVLVVAAPRRRAAAGAPAVRSSS